MQSTDGHSSTPDGVSQPVPVTGSVTAVDETASATLTAMLFDTSAVGVGFVDREMRYLRVNAALAAMNGMPAQAHAGRAVRDVLPAVAADVLEPLLRRVMETGEPVVDLAFEADVPGRASRHFLASYYPVRDAAGVVIAVAAVVAERTPAEAALRETEGLLRRVAESGIIGLFFWKLGGEITEANDTFLEMLGYTREDVSAGRVDWRAMTPREYAERDAAAVRELLATGRHGPLPKEYVGRDGRRVPVVVTSAFLEGSSDRGVCVCLDDTARRDAESRLTRVLMQTPAAVAVLLGPDHVVQSTNEMFLRLLGRRNYVGRPAREVAPELAEQGFLALMDEVYRTGVPYVAREAALVWDRDGDGTLHRAYFDFVYQPLVDQAGAVEGILVFAIDVTAQVLARQETDRARAEVEAALRHAEQASRAKSEFLAVMSHELRTPLNAIGGYAELLELGIHGPVTPEQAKALERIQRSQRHLLGLINRVLNYVKVDAGAVHYALEEVEMDEVLAACETLTAPQVGAKRLDFRYASCDSRLAARADREKLQQVVLNLLSNAVKFTDPGGRVTLECAGSGDGRVLVRISDTGRGIPADQLERVFQPFVQLDASLTRTHEGTGLGLAISRDLARGMGGDLTAESALGVGSTFTLSLPAA